MAKRVTLFLAVFILLGTLIAGDTTPVRADSITDLQRLNTAYKQTGVYITRLKAVPYYKRTAYQNARLAYWLKQRASIKTRYDALRSAIYNPPDPAPVPTTTPKPANYVANASCWDAPCYHTDQTVWQFTNALGQYSVFYPSRGYDGSVPPSGKPVYVLIPGGPLAPGTSSVAGMEMLVAMRGGVGFRADYRSQRQYGGGSPQAYQDVACAIRGARIEAPKYGGDPSRVTLIAHSFGGWIAWNLLLGNWAPGPECKYQTGNWRPDQYVNLDAIANTSQIGSHFRETDYPDSFVVENEVKTTSHKMPVLVVWGTWDIVANINVESPILYQNLLSSGWPVTKVEVQGDHSSPLVDDAVLDWVLGGRP